jgi:hypothetical protein
MKPESRPLPGWVGLELRAGQLIGNVSKNPIAEDWPAYSDPDSKVAAAQTNEYNRESKLY